AAATSSTTPAGSSSTSSHSSRAAERRRAPRNDSDRSDGQATLPAAKPLQSAPCLPRAPLRADAAELVARRATRRPGYRPSRAAPAPAERRRRHRASRAHALAFGGCAASDQRQSASSATPAAVNALPPASVVLDAQIRPSRSVKTLKHTCTGSALQEQDSRTPLRRRLRSSTC